MALTIPSPVHDEHRCLHARLEEATRLSGRTGEAARAVAGRLHPHLRREEEFALPPLSLLPALADGSVPADAGHAIALATRLKAALPEMLGEHRAIEEALDGLLEAAGSEGHAGAAVFAADLRRHAETEEQILYPAAILIGEYLKLWMARAD